MSQFLAGADGIGPDELHAYDWLAGGVGRHVVKAGFLFASNPSWHHLMVNEGHFFGWTRSRGARRGQWAPFLRLGTATLGACLVIEAHFFGWGPCSRSLDPKSSGRVT